MSVGKKKLLYKIIFIRRNHSVNSNNELKYLNFFLFLISVLTSFYIHTVR